MATLMHSLWRVYQTYCDRSIVYLKSRWVALAIALLFYFIRVFTIGGFYVVTYALSIFLLNLFLRFLTPIKADLEDEDSDNPVLPIREKDEFKPMLRKLGEFKFWKAGCVAVIIAHLCTFVQALDVPVFWPVLVMYFIILFVVTMRRQIAHMIKHKYLPFDHGKASYNKKDFR